MKQRDKRMLAALAFGAIGTVVTTWATAWLPGDEYEPQDLPELRWPLPPPEGWPNAPERAEFNVTLYRTTSSASHGLERFTESLGTDPTVTWYHMIERQSGWPVRAMVRWQVQRQVVRTITPVRLSLWNEGLQVPRWLQTGWARNEALPLRPLPLGFATNTLLYGTIAWGLMRLVTPYRRWRAARRTRRGRCVQCGYAVRGLQGCPECGKPVEVPSIE